MNIASNISTLIGNTPLVKLQKIVPTFSGQLLVKLEQFNPGGSVKDRAASAMIKAAEEQGQLKPGVTIIEPTSGNTGIALALICAVKGYPLIIVMPDSMTPERRTILEMYGAKTVLTPGYSGMQGAIDKAQQLIEKDRDAIMLQQFENRSNPEIHKLTTGPEIWEDTQGRIDVLVAGVGTGGTITGCGQYLKSKNPKIEIVAVEPDGSAVISGEKPGPHMIQGIGAGFIPGNLDKTVIDKICRVTNYDAYDTVDQVSKKEGLFVGPSAGAAIYAASQLANEPSYQQKTIVTIAPDSGERYFSMKEIRGQMNEKS